MNILVVSHYGLYKDFGSSFVHNQVKEFAALGHNVRVIIPIAIGKPRGDNGRMESVLKTMVADGVQLYYLRFVSLSNFGKKYFNVPSAIGMLWGQLGKITKGFVPDVIHAHTLGFDSEIGVWLKKRFYCPLVVTTHGSDVAIPLQNGECEYLRTVCDKADVVVAVSSALREKVRGCGTSTRLETINNGFVPRERLPESLRHPYRMIQVCNLIPLKRVDVTIRAFAQLQKKYPQMELIVVGQGPQRTQLEELCAQLNVTDKVRFMGQLPNDIVFEELSKSAFFVMVSKPEGFGIAYLEAMAAGCIAIGTEGEGISDLIVSGSNGYLVQADAPESIVQVIEDCLSHPKDAETVAKAGETAARELTWKKNVCCYLELFRSLANP